MEHPFGELVEACLAINLGYLALERFRYHEAIKRIVENAGTHLDGMPEAFKTDRAWEDLSNIRQKPGPGAQSKFLHFMYQQIFSRGIDRKIATAAALVSFLTLIARAIHPNLGGVWASASALGGEWVLLLFLIVTTALSGLLIKVGQKCVNRVAQAVMENVIHLAKRYRDESKSEPEKMNAFITQLAQEHF